MKATPSAINQYLDEKGFKHSNLGYGYIIRAVELASENAVYLQMVTRKLYPQIAEEFNTAPSRVERAIRHAIETSREYALVRPTNSEFIASTVDYFKYKDGEK